MAVIFEDIQSDDAHYHVDANGAMTGPPILASNGSHKHRQTTGELDITGPDLPKGANHVHRMGGDDYYMLTGPALK